jgi:hypothetical protein
MHETVINYFRQKVEEQEARRKELHSEEEAKLEEVVEDSAMAEETIPASAMEEVPADETAAMITSEITEPFVSEKTDKLIENDFPAKQINIYFMSTIGPGEKKQKLLINLDQKVNTIKETVSNSFGLNPIGVHLSYDGITLNEDSILEEFNIKDGDTILLIPSSRAGLTNSRFIK